MLGARKTDLHPSFVYHMSRVDSLVTELQTRSQAGEIAQTLEIMGKTLTRYGKSVQTSLDLQQTMGLTAEPGTLAQLRTLQDSIHYQLRHINAPSLSVQFSRMLLLEKDFSNTLNMKLADQLLRLAADIEVSAGVHKCIISGHFLVQQPYKNNPKSTAVNRPPATSSHGESPQSTHWWQYNPQRWDRAQCRAATPRKNIRADLKTHWPATAHCPLHP